MFLPENIDLAHSEKYSLSIRLTPDGFSFCIRDAADPTVFHYQETGLGKKISYTENIRKLIFDYGFFTQPFKNARIVVVSADYTLVPEDFWEKKKKKELFGFNFHDKERVVLTDAPEGGDFRILYGLNEDLHSFLSRNIWNPQFSHHTSHLYPTLRLLHENDAENRCLVDFHDAMATALCFSGEKLLSANTFSTANASNALYFIAGIWKQHSFNQTDDLLVLSGKTDTLHDVRDTLKQLIRRVETVGFSPKTQMTEEQKKSIPSDLLVQL